MPIRPLKERTGMEKKLRKKCEKLHKQNKFGEIITLLEGQPHDDYDAASQ